MSAMVSPIEVTAEPERNIHLDSSLPCGIGFMVACSKIALYMPNNCLRHQDGGWHRLSVQ